MHKDNKVVKSKEVFTIKAFKTLLDNLKEIEVSKDEKYNKHYCELGFFENYYGALTKERFKTNEPVSEEN